MLDRRAYRYAIIGLGVAEALFVIGVSTIAALGHAPPKELWAVGTALGGGLLGVLVPRPQGTPGPAQLIESSAVHNAAAAAAAASVASAVQATAAQAEGETAAQTVERVATRAQAAVDDISGKANLRLAIDAASAAAGGVGAAGAAASELAEHHNARARELENQAQAPAAQKTDELAAQAAVYRAAARAAQRPETLKAATEAAEAAPKGKVQVGDYLAKMGPPAAVFLAALGFGTLLLTGVFAPAKPYTGQALKEGQALLALAITAGGAMVGVLAPSPGQSAASGQQSGKA